jgi:NhaP-type Na+/H+ or K+/H+ antiporter
MPAIKTYREAIFSGWFGPMGVGAVFLSTIAKEELKEVYKGKEMPVSVQIISPVVLFIVFCSVIVHGTTIPLFKLGKRIRTRTLSISSIGSNQVLRLPKLQFGQQLAGKRGMDEEQQHHNHQVHTPMTELERNTLFNTLQYTKEDATTTVISMQPPQRNHLHHGDSDSDIAEEDFLPDDTASDHGIDNVQCGSGVSLDAQQAIRFVEPLKKPRTSTPALKQEKTEILAPSLKKSWLRHSLREEDEGQHGFKHLFKRFHGHNDTASNAQKHLDSRIEVWEEGDHVVVEDKQNTKEVVVIDKHQGDWKDKTKEKIKQVEDTIRNQEQEQNESPSTTASSLSASSSSTKQ